MQINNDIISGERLELRPITEMDTENIIRWRNSDFIRNNFIYQELFTVESQKKWLAEKVNTGKVVQYIIHEKETDTDIGSVYLRDIDKEEKKAEFGIFIGEKEKLGKGYGTECIKLLCDYGFEKLGLSKIYLRVLGDNEPAKRLYERAGFLQEAYLEAGVTIKEEHRNLIMMKLYNPKEDIYA